MRNWTLFVSILIFVIFITVGFIAHSDIRKALSDTRSIELAASKIEMLSAGKKDDQIVQIAQMAISANLNLSKRLLRLEEKSLFFWTVSMIAVSITFFLAGQKYK